MSLRTAITVLFVCALWPGAEGQRLSFSHITTSDGLPAAQVLCLHQTPDGSVWIGTENGLARHQGSTIRLFHSDRTDDHSLPNEEVHDVITDAQGRLWFATAGGIARYRPHSGDFERFSMHGEGPAFVTADRVMDILPEPDGSSIWAVTEAGLFRLDAASGEVRSMRGALAASGQVSKLFGRSIAEDRGRDGIWFGTDQGLRFFDRKSGTIIGPKNDADHRSCFSEGPVSCPVVASDGALWYFDIRAKELVRTVPEKHLTQRWSASSVHPYPYTLQFMAFGRDGRLWLSTWTYDLLVFDPTTGAWSQVKHDDDDPTSLIDDNVKAMIEDSQGTLWLGTRSGISLMVPTRQGLHVSRSVNGASITTLLSLRDGRVAVGTDSAGLWAGRITDGRFIEARRATITGPWPSAQAGHVSFVSQDAQGSINVVMDNRIGSFDPSAMRVHCEDRLPQLDADLRRSRIVFVDKDREQRFWVGTWSKGILRMMRDGTRSDRLGTMDSAAVRLPVNGMICCITTANGDRWVGMNAGGGLARFPADGSSPTFYGGGTGDGALANAVVTCLAEGPDGAIWAGTHAGGIDRLDLRTQRFTHYSLKEGLPGARVLALAFDHQHDLWATTIGGIALLDEGARQFVTVALPQSVRTADLGGALCVMRDGSVVFGIDDRLLVIDPQRMSNGPAPGVRVVALTTMGTIDHDPSTGGTIELPFDRRSLSIQLGALVFEDPARTTFAYRLADLAAGWSDIGHTGRVDLNDLPPGDHRIELRASVDGSHWSMRPACLRVTVLPPFWAAWWFRLLVGLACAAGLVLTFALYLRRRLRGERERHEREQAILQERMRIAGDMHDDLGAGLSALKLRSEMALRMERDPGKRAQLSGLASTAGELMGTMRQIIWTLNDDQSTLEDLVVYTTNYARTYCEENGLTAHIDAGGPWPSVQLSSEQRRAVFLVVKEALHNVVKHAHATEVRARMWTSNGLSVEINDNGSGLPQGADLGAGNGLRGMKRRITAQGGVFSATSERGTRIVFNVPLAPSTNQGSIA